MFSYKAQEFIYLPNVGKSLKTSIEKNTECNDPVQFTITTLIGPFQKKQMGS